MTGLPLFLLFGVAFSAGVAYGLVYRSPWAKWIPVVAGVVAGFLAAR